jgi:2-polyprenyl-3-methyl-5-hydroxy-6-metoxy-1,4-benzoquinol methylase
MNQPLCIVCDAAVAEVLDLGMQPLANSLLKNPAETFDSYPLGLAGCSHCGHAQLSHFADPSLLFEDYLYASGTSRTLQLYFDWFASALKNHLHPGARVLEIASNDGSLLSRLAAEGLQVFGVDPAANLSNIARSKGYSVLTGFFPEAAPDGQFDAIIAMNVCAHTPDPLYFMQGLAKALKPDGLALIQTSQALMIANGEFDTIYHEHYSFYSVASMRELAKRVGLVLQQVELVSVHGTSFLFILRQSGASERVLKLEGAFHVSWPDPVPSSLTPAFTGAEAVSGFKSFALSAHRLMQDVQNRIRDHRNLGRDIALVGVAAKALTFVRAAEIPVDIYFDEAALKIGLYVPGAQVPVRHLSEISDLDRETVFIIGAWNFAAELIEKMRALPAKAQHRILVHLPRIREDLLGSPKCGS